MCMLAAMSGAVPRPRPEATNETHCAEEIWRRYATVMRNQKCLSGEEAARTHRTLSQGARSRRKTYSMRLVKRTSELADGPDKTAAKWDTAREREGNQSEETLTAKTRSWLRRRSGWCGGARTLTWPGNDAVLSAATRGA